MSDDNNNYGGSDDDRYYYEHYEGKDYYDEVGHGRPRLSFDVVIYNFCDLSADNRVYEIVRIRGDIKDDRTKG